MELYHGTFKIAESNTGGTSWGPIDVTVSAADNGTQNYTARVYNAAGEMAESPVVSVLVDIRWVFVHTFGLFGTPVVATDATGAVYVASSDSHTAFLDKRDSDGSRQWVREFGAMPGSYE